LSSRAGWGRCCRRATLQARIGRRCHPAKDRPALPVAVVGHVVGGRERRRVVAEGLADLGRGPDEGLALFAIGVRVLARRERAVVAAELAKKVVERALRDGAVAVVAGRLPSVDVGPRELGVVV